MQHAHELQQVVKGDLLRRELRLEFFLDVVEAAAAVEHAQDRELFVVEAEVVQPDRLLHDPERPAVIAMAARVEIGPHPQRQRTRGRANQAFGKVAMDRLILTQSHGEETEGSKGSKVKADFAHLSFAFFATF